LNDLEFPKSIQHIVKITYL